ncbi:peroxidase-like protein [Ylistrum balloti]|uniref:peroxidase-like protein n=1 Tax=Ylistrum balloti TaxID=509963 RepID=UPI002905A348|nr:peroxidase-like protein [Ylistrum balloti]
MASKGESTGDINSLIQAIRNAIDLTLREVSSTSNLFQSDAAARFAELERKTQFLVIALDRNSQLIQRAMIIFEQIARVSWIVILKSPILLMEWRTRIAPICSISPVRCDPFTPYRTIEGQCNNLNFPLWGSKMSPQERLIRPFYDDGLNSPRTKSVAGGDLPNARVISNEFHRNTGQAPVLSKIFTNMFFAYGQFLDHDITLTPVLKGRLRLTAMNLPLSGSADMCMLSSPGHHCFLAGDGRRHEVPSLTTLHVIFAREHNLLARGLRLTNPHWHDERLFQEARRILGAELQHIAFNEYLPIVLGTDVMIKLGLIPTAQGYRTVYEETINPTTTSSFSTAAFRYGHSQIPSVLGLMSKDGIIVDEMPLHTQFDRPDILFNRDGSENLMRWLTNSHHEENDRLISDSVRNNLMQNMGPLAMDLAATNIQRGRDHGIPPYNFFREWCGLRPVIHFGKGPGGLNDHDDIARIFLSKLYRNPNDLDLFTAGVSEKNLPNAAVGPTFSCIIATQFNNYQRGDRFYYENANLPGSFTVDQLNEIKRKTTLAAIQCRNSRIHSTQPQQFLKPDHIR